MNNRDTAINIMGWAMVAAEPAGSSGAFWSIKGPRRSTREVAVGDIAACRDAIERALDAKDATIAALRAEVERLTTPSPARSRRKA